MSLRTQLVWGLHTQYCAVQPSMERFARIKDVMINDAEEFVRLRTSHNMTDYRRAAQEEAPISVWVEIISRFPEMKVWVAHNKSIPLDILRVLAIDPDAHVRAAVADKRKLDRALFESLAQDPDEGVRQRVACNKKTPRDLLETLARDESLLVARVAKERIGPG